MLDLAKAIHDAIGIESPRLFIVICALVGALLFGVAGWLVDAGYQAKVRQEYAVVPASVQGNATQSKSSSAPTSVVREGHRIFLPGDIDFEYLTGLYKDRTSMQGDQLAQNYLHKWITATLIVRDTAYRSRISEYTVYCRLPNHKEFPRGTLLDVNLYFEGPWGDQISVLRKDSRIKVIGEIDRIASRFVTLVNCEFVQ